MRHTGLIVCSIIIAMLAFSMNSTTAVATTTLDGDWIVVEAEGRGKTAKEARKDAMLNGLREIAGEYLDEKTIIDNGELVESTLLTFTTDRGFKSRDIGEPEFADDGSWIIRMEISIIPRDFKSALGNLAVQKSISGEATAEADGSGETVQDARRDAIAKALKKIVGEYITSEIKISNGKVVNDLITSFTRTSNVTSEQVGKLRPDGDAIVVTMRVTAQLEPLYTMFRNRSTSATAIDGDVLAAELDLARDNLNAKRSILEKLMKELPARLLIARLIDREGNPLRDGRPGLKDKKVVPDTTEVALALNIECYFDLATYYERVAPSLCLALEAMADDVKVNSFQLTAEDFTGSSNLFTGTRHAGHSFDSMVADSRSIDPSLIRIDIAVSRSANGQILTFNSYYLPRDLYEAFSNACNTKSHHLDVQIAVNMLDENGDLIKHKETLASYQMWSPGKRVATFGKDLPISAGSNSIYKRFFSFSFAQGYNGLGRNIIIIVPGWRYFMNLGDIQSDCLLDSTVHRMEFRLPESILEQIDRIELKGKLIHSGKDGYNVTIPNPEIKPTNLSWLGLDGEPIDAGKNRTLKYSGNRSKGRVSTSPNRDAKQSTEAVDKKTQVQSSLSMLKNYGKINKCDKISRFAEELLAIDYFVNSSELIWEAASSCGECSRVKRKFLELLVEKHPDATITQFARMELERP